MSALYHVTLHSLFILMVNSEFRIPSPIPLDLDTSVSPFSLVQQSSNPVSSVLYWLYFTVYRSTYVVSFQCTNMHKSTSGFYLYLRRFSRASILLVISSSKSQIKEKESAMPVLAYNQVQFDLN